MTNHTSLAVSCRLCRVAGMLLLACLLGCLISFLQPFQAHADGSAESKVETRITCTVLKSYLTVGDTLSIDPVVQYKTADGTWSNIAEPTYSVSTGDEAVMKWEDGKLSAIGLGETSIILTYAGDDAYASSTYAFTCPQVCGEEFTVNNVSYRATTEDASGQSGEVTVVSVAAAALKDSALTLPATVSNGGVAYKITDFGSLADWSGVCSSVQGVITSADLSKTGISSISSAFCDCAKLKSVELPSTLTTIGSRAFEESGLSAIEIPESVTTLADSAFSYTGLTSVKLPSALTTIEGSAFSGCDKLESIEFPSALVTIGTSAFSGCASLKSVSLPSTLITIGNGAFECTGLQSVVIPNGVLAIGAKAFGSCADLQSVTLSASVTSIDTAFAYSKALKSVTIPEDSYLQNIDTAFRDCSSLQSVYLPAKVSQYNDWTFYGCTSLTDITVASDSASFSMVDGLLYDKGVTCLLLVPAGKQIVEYDSPETVVAVAANVFKNSKVLKSVKLNGTSAVAADEPCIGASAFQGCTALESVVFPAGACSYIGASAFQGCAALATVDFSKTDSLDRTKAAYGDSNPRVGQRAFSGCVSLKELSFPALLGVGKRNPMDMTSGYSSAWHEDVVLHPSGFSAGALSGCSSLEKLVFETGNSQGMYGYFPKSGAIFNGCSKLTAIVFEGAQAYWTNPNTAMQNGSFVDYWSDNSIDAPALYYAVDYYASSDADTVSADDSMASKRYARVEYKRGAPVKSLVSSDAEALKQYLYANAADYASPDAAAYKDGIIPDANAAAAKAGLDTSKKWCWKLDTTQQFRKTLTDSCRAYLVQTDDISAATIESTTLESMHFYADRGWTTYQDGFDAARYAENKDGDLYRWIFTNKSQSDAEENADVASVWFEATGAGANLDDISIYGTDGKKINWQDSSKFDVSWEMCTGAEDGVVRTTPVEKLTSTAPYLMTITPKAGSGYSTASSLKEWILVRAHDDEVAVYDARGGSDASNTYDQAYSPVRYINGSTVSSYWKIECGTAYTVLVNNNDTLGALIGAEVAGLSQARVRYSSDASSDKNTGGFSVTTTKGTGAWARNGKSADAYAVWAYTYLNSHKGDYGLEGDVWGDTALLCSGQDVDNLASLANCSYRTKSPIFFTDGVGNLSDETLACLKGFKNVLVVGDEDVVSADVAARAKAAVSGDVTRVEYAKGDATGASIALAQHMKDSGMKIAYSAIADAQDQLDAVVGTVYTGNMGGAMFVAGGTADAKRVVAWMRGARDSLDEVRLFGRTEGSFGGYDVSDALMPGGWDNSEHKWDSSSSIWDETAAAKLAGKTDVTAGDTICIDGMLLTIQSDGSLAYDGKSYYGNESLSKGQKLSCQQYTIDSSTNTVTASTVERTLSSVPSGYLVDPKLALSASSAEMVVNGQASYGVSYGGDGSLSVASSDEKVATAQLVDGKLTVKALAVGSATITLSAPATQAYKAATVELPVSVSLAAQKITVERNISKELSDDPFSLNASALGGVKLTYESDDEDVATVDANGKVTLKSVGAVDILIKAERTEVYSAASVTVELKVSQGQLAKAKFAAIAAKTYTGKALTPAVTVSLGGKTLVKDTDYTVSYANNVKPGKATVTISGAGSYTGEAVTTFVINKLSQKLTVKTATKSVKAAKAKKKARTVKAITKVTGAKGKLSYKKAGGAAKLTVNAKTGKITVKKGTKKGSYKVKVKVTAAATSYCAAASKTVTVNVKVK